MTDAALRGRIAIIGAEVVRLDGFASKTRRDYAKPSATLDEALTRFETAARRKRAAHASGADAA